MTLISNTYCHKCNGAHPKEGACTTDPFEELIALSGKQIRILVSSKYLASKLKEIDFEFESVGLITLNGLTLSLITGNRKVDIQVESSGFKGSLQQSGRWDWVYKYVNRIEDCPIVLRITEQNITIEIHC